MLDVAIVGGGLCGLALAHSLQARRTGWALFEARPRLGGRVLTARGANGLPLDLGPTWYWPATQPSLTRLVADLGLASLAQPDDELQRLAICITGLGVHMHVGYDVVQQLAPQLHDGADALDQWADRLVRYALAMIDAERARRATHEELACATPPLR